MFRAGTDSAVQSLGLWLARWPVRWGWPSSLGGLAPWLLPLQRLTAGRGSDRSGMVVRLSGGRRVERSWTLVASDGHGPEIPALPAAILAERILSGALAPGVRDAGEVLDLAGFAPAFADLSIRHEVREFPQAEPPRGPRSGPREGGGTRHPTGCTSPPGAPASFDVPDAEVPMSPPPPDASAGPLAWR